MRNRRRPSDFEPKPPEIQSILDGLLTRHNRDENRTWRRYRGGQIVEHESVMAERLRQFNKRVPSD